MLFDLTKILLEDGAVLEKSIPISLEEVRFRQGVYPVLQKEPVRVKVTNTGKKVLEIEAAFSVSLEIPCARCLTGVKQDFTCESTFTVDRKKTDRELEEEDEDISFMEGNVLNLEKLITNELLIQWPIRVLCKEDCKGICSRCGANLNTTTCDCDRYVPDPRMAAIQDIFKNFNQ